MFYNACEIHKPIKLIKIDKGEVIMTGPGKFNLVAVRQRPRENSPDILDYFVLESNQGIGAIRRFWEDKEDEGFLTLIRGAREGDPTLDGVKFPITSPDQLTSDQKEIKCGYLINGYFHCMKCAEGKVRNFPVSVHITANNIIPYSQNCHICKLQLFEIWKSRAGGPLNLFREPQK